MRKILIATNNKDKVREIRETLSDMFSREVELLTLKEKLA